MIILLLLLLVLGQVALLLWLKSSDKALLTELAAALKLPAEEKSHWSLWHSAIKKSQALMGKAELESVRIVADSKYYTKLLETVYEDQLKAAVSSMEKELGKVMGQAQNEYGKYLATIEEQSQNLVDDAISGFTKRLEESLTGIEGRILKLAQEEGMRVKMEVEQYRKTMMAAVDDEIGEILDEVSKTVIGKSLTQNEQTGLILEALERAKREKLLDLKPI